MSAEPLTRYERDRALSLFDADHDDEIVVTAGLARALEATVQAETERAERLRVAIRDARGLYDQAMMESRFGVAHHLRVSADKIMHDAIAADDAARGDQ